MEEVSAETLEKDVLRGLDRKKMQHIHYKDVSKKPLLQQLKDALPEGAVATPRAPKIFGFIFAAVVIIGAIQFPYSGIFSQNLEVSSKIGIPYTFLEFNLNRPNQNPVHIKNMIIDILIYIFLAYLIDITINIIAHASIFKKKEELRGIPRAYQIKK